MQGASAPVQVLGGPLASAAKGGATVASACAPHADSLRAGCLDVAAGDAGELVMAL